MGMIRVLMGRTLTDAEGKKTSFYANSKGTVYDRFCGSVRKVGIVDKNGRIHYSPNYVKKCKHRIVVLQRILTELSEKEKEWKGA